jgi:hypothetical protein
MPRNEAGARRARSFFETTLNVDDDAEVVTSDGGQRRICKEERGGVQVPIAFRPIGLIRHNGCPIDSGESGRRPGASRRVNRSKNNGPLNQIFGSVTNELPSSSFNCFRRFHPREAPASPPGSTKRRSARGVGRRPRPRMSRSIERRGP